jgi:hypothetical protein
MKTTALILLPLVVLGASSTPDPNQVAAAARQVPAEFAADAMIRVASSTKLDTRARVKLLTEAFERAAEAQPALRMRGSITRPGSSGGYLERAYGQEIDALSLRLRAVHDMLPLDSAKASKLFLSIPRPTVPSVHCEQNVVYNVDLYYEGLGAIAKIGHPNVAKLLKDRVRGITSPAQIAPVARLLLGAGLKDADLRSFTGSLASNLREIGADDRAFTYYAAAAGPAVADLVEELQRRHLSPLPLAEAYRSYLVNHLSGERCADGYLVFNGPMTVNLANGQPSETLGWGAATLFAEKILLPPLKPLTEQETTPKSLEGFAAGTRTCEDAKCQHMNDLVRYLAFTPDGTPLLDSERDSDAWRTSLQTVLAALEAWQPGKGEADDVFREKTWVYNNLYAMSHSRERQLVVHSWLDYLKQSRAAVSDRAEWLLPVSALIGRSAMDPGNRGMAELLRTSEDPVIALYVQVEALAPRAPEKILPLL